ncbi:MAG: hypothetical protein M0R51_13955 [Clostridia bacterium]|jgi:hypothetical protein|nr:hypothetical protein [Clostridia bacterium]
MYDKSIPSLKLNNSFTYKNINELNKSIKEPALNALIYKGYIVENRKGMRCVYSIMSDKNTYDFILHYKAKD